MRFRSVAADAWNFRRFASEREETGRPVSAWIRMTSFRTSRALSSSSFSREAKSLLRSVLDSRITQMPSAKRLPASARVAIRGRGRAGRALARALGDAGIPAAFVPRSRPRPAPLDLLVLAVPDDAVA